MSFHCPRCDEKTKVLSTRVEFRERVCPACQHVFRTEEIEYDGPIPDWRTPRKNKATTPNGRILHKSESQNRC